MEQTHEVDGYVEESITLSQALELMFNDEEKEKIDYKQLVANLE